MTNVPFYFAHKQQKVKNGKYILHGVISQKFVYEWVREAQVGTSGYDSVRIGTSFLVTPHFPVKKKGSLET